MTEIIIILLSIDHRKVKHSCEAADVEGCVGWDIQILLLHVESTCE